MFRNGDRVRFDILAFVPVHHAPEVVRDAGLTDEQGWIPVRPLDFPNIA